MFYSLSNVSLRGGAGAPGVVARALPGSLALDEVPGAQGVQVDGFQDFPTETDGETIDLLVPPMIWGLPEAAVHSQALKVCSNESKLSPFCCPCCVDSNSLLFML